jgi:hypothetical protein
MENWPGVEETVTRLENQLTYTQGGLLQGKILAGNQMTGLYRRFGATRYLASLASKAGSCFPARYAS